MFSKYTREIQGGFYEKMKHPHDQWFVWNNNSHKVPLVTWLQAYKPNLKSRILGT